MLRYIHALYSPSNLPVPEPHFKSASMSAVSFDSDRSEVLRSPVARIFLLGMIVGATYLPVTLQITVGSGFLGFAAQVITFFFFPVCWAAFGLGLAFPAWRGGRKAIGLGGLALSCFLVLGLKLPLFVDQQGWLLFRLLVCLVNAMIVYLLFGQISATIFEKGAAAYHRLYGFFMLGCVAGGLSSDRLVELLGANSLLVFLAGSLLLAAITPAAGAVGSALLLVGLWSSNADLHLERLRNVGSARSAGSLTAQTDAYAAESALREYSTKLEHLAWNRRGMSLIYKTPEQQQYAALVNLRSEFNVLSDPERDSRNGRKLVYSLIEPGQRAALIGAGAGSSLHYLLPEARTKNIHSVEREGNLVKLTRQLQLNPLLQYVNYVAAEGRAFVEKSGLVWDWIVLESAIGQKNSNPLLLFMPNYLYTREGINLFLSRLGERGTLVVEVNRPSHRRREHYLEAIEYALEQRSLPGFAGYIVSEVAPHSRDAPMQTLLVLTKNPQLGPKLIAGNSPSIKVSALSSRNVNACTTTHTDDSPFLDWACYDDRLRLLTLVGSCLMTLFLLGVAVPRFIVLRRREAPLPFSALSALACLSMGQTMLFLAVAYRVRSVFLDEVASFFALIFFSTAVSGVASLLSHGVLLKLGEWDRRGRVLLCCVLAALPASIGYLYWLTGVPAFHSGSFIVRAAFFALAIAPSFFLLTAFFHLLWHAAVKDSGNVREALVVDAIAIVPAYALIPLILFQFGISALFAGAAVVIFLGVMIHLGAPARR
jgi:hypothetical protein